MTNQISELEQFNQLKQQFLQAEEHLMLISSSLQSVIWNIQREGNLTDELIDEIESLDYTFNQRGL